MGHVTLTTPTWGMVHHTEANTPYGQPVEKNVKSLALAIPEIYFRGVKLQNEGRNPDHNPFRGDLPPADWDFLCSTDLHEI